MTISIIGAIVPQNTTITANTVTTVLSLGRLATLASITVCPTTGTPSLSVSIYDGTTRRYLRKAVAMTAGTPFVYDTPQALNRKDAVEVTSSSATGDMDVFVNYLSEASGRPGAT